jgi:hypothetical protein
MHSVGRQPDSARRWLRSGARRDWLGVMAAVGALVVCLTVALFLALIGSAPLLLFAVSLCTAIALFEVAVIVTTRFRP